MLGAMPKAVYGLTGGIASGKSSVAAILERLGAVIVDSDVLAREVVEPGTKGLAAIVRRFGEGVLLPDGGLDRAALGGIVFADAQARADLNGIVHPLVRRRAQERVAAAPADAIVVQVIPLLVETGLQDAFDGVIVVDVPEDVQLARLTARDAMSEDEARRRIAAQASREARLASARWVIDNSGGTGRTAKQVKSLWDDLSRQ